MKTSRLTILIILAMLFGCASAQAQSETEMSELGSALTKLSSAVESTVRFKKQGEGLSEEQLLVLSTRHDPSLLAPFQGYRLHVLRESGHAAVLVCSPDGHIALLEDAGCTARMDQHHWNAYPKRPCRFTLDLMRVCPN